MKDASGRPGELALAGISAREAASLARQGIRSLESMAFWFPRWHVNRARLVNFAQAKEGKKQFFHAVVSNIGVFTRGRLHILKLQLADEAGARAFLYWFNRPYMIKEFKKGAEILIYDSPEKTQSGVRFSGKAGTCEVLSEPDSQALKAGSMLVFYRTTTVFDQRRAREMAAQALEEILENIQDPVPAETQARNGLMGLRQAVREAHKPAGWPEWEKARRRLVFDQLFLLQAALGLNRRTLAGIRKRRSYAFGGERLKTMLANLPFEFTAAQERVEKEIFGDLAKESPMNRLLQGDVGSGKTVVAAAAAAVMADSGYQAAVMAPTEILAEQHFVTFRRLLGPAGVRVGLLISGKSRGEKRQLKKGLEGGYFDLVVGTHALIEEAVSIPKLGLAVIDERHKFGVRQRAKLEGKGAHPDLLMMTATPLPRALVLTQYGDTSLSVLDGMPPGRGGIDTKWLHGAMQREQAYRIAAERMAKGERAFAVFPLVETSEHLLLRDATREFERLKKKFPGFKVGLIHGKMAAAEKESVMGEFASGAISLLVCTTVVEVGIDVPEATVMLIEHANRFGLAQLHQLRGRVGRGPNPSVCLLITGGMLTADARERLATLVRTASGFDLAEKDLRLRGPGEMFGTKQHGTSDLEYVDHYLDIEELQAAQAEAEALLERDPGLKGPDGAKIRKAIDSRLSRFWGLVRAS